jgi:hypothetical protein
MGAIFPTGAHRQLGLPRPARLTARRKSLETQNVSDLSASGFLIARIRPTPKQIDQSENFDSRRLIQRRRVVAARAALTCGDRQLCDRRE